MLFVVCCLSFDAVCCDLCIVGGLELFWYYFVGCCWLFVVCVCLFFLLMRVASLLVVARC